MKLLNILMLLIVRHKTRLHIGQLVKDTSYKLKKASETDHRAEVSVSDCHSYTIYTSDTSLTFSSFMVVSLIWQIEQ